MQTSPWHSQQSPRPPPLCCGLGGRLRRDLHGLRGRRGRWFVVFFYGNRDTRFLRLFSEKLLRKGPGKHKTRRRHCAENSGNENQAQNPSCDPAPIRRRLYDFFLINFFSLGESVILLLLCRDISLVFCTAFPVQASCTAGRVNGGLRSRSVCSATGNANPSPLRLLRHGKRELRFASFATPREPRTPLRFVCVADSYRRSR